MYIDIATANSAVLGTNRILLNAGHADSATTASTAAALDHDVSVTLTGDTTGSGSSTGSTSWAIATTTNRMRQSAITVKTGDTAQAHISLQTFMTWMITTKKYIPSDVNCYKYFPISWSYAGNDILQFTANSVNYELQLAGCIIEFWGNATSYNAGVFRLRFHTSPAQSWTAASGYNKVPIGCIVEYTCNGSGYAPTWRIYADTSNIAWAAWTAGTTEGPKANIKIGFNTYTSAAIPAASATASGIVTIGSQTFKGVKTFNDIVHLKASVYEDSAGTGALNLNNSDIYGVNSIKFADLADSAGEGLQWYRDASHVDSLWVKSGVIYFTPNRTYGGTATNYTVLHSNNVSWSAWTNGTTEGPKANLSIGGSTITSAAIPAAGASASGVVTISDQTFHGTKTFETGITVTGTFTGFSQTAWTAGTTAGPVPNYKIGTTAITGIAVPAAAAGASGIVTTAAQQFDGNKTFKGHIYTQANNTYNIGAEAKRFQTLYLSAALYMGATTFKAYNSAVQGTYICPGGIGLSNTTAGQGLYLRGGAEQYARFYIQTIGVKPTATTTDGTTTYSGAKCGEVYLELGNNKVYSNSTSGVDHNARGRIRFYGTTTGYTDLLVQNPTTSGRVVYLPNADHADPILMPTYDLSGTQDLDTKYNAGIYCIEGGHVSNYPTGSTAYANLIVIPYRKPQGNTKSDHALQIYGHSVNRLWFRGSDASSWRAWREFAHIAANTKTGSDKKGVYVAADGTITACSYELNAGTNAGTQYQLAYYSTTVAISSTTKIATNGTYLSLTDTTDATKYDGSDGVLRVKGGISIAKSIRLGQKLYLGANTQSAADADSGIHIWDTRNVSHLPNTFGDQTVQWYFDNTEADAGRGGWSTIMHMKGWNGNYAAHQMSFNAADGTGDGNIYHRTGSSNAWKSWTIPTTAGTTTTTTWRLLLDNVSINDSAASPFRLTTITKSLTPTQEWIDTGITGDNIPDNGSYIVQIYANTTASTNLAHYEEYYTGVMSWYASATNSTDADEIVLHKAGHASNGQNLYLRTIRVASSGTMKLQIKASKTCTTAGSYVFRFRKMI